MMESVVAYFSEIPSSHRTAIIVVGLTFFSLLESAVPLISLDYGRWKHAGVNLFFTLTTILVNFFLAFLLLGISDWVVSAGYGVLGWIKMPLALQFLVGLLMLDFFGAYVAHWVQHKVKWMWQFHAVHHTDQHLDVTSANRHHPGESVVRLVFTLIATVITGAPIWLVMIYQSLSVVLSQFNHSNFTLSSRVDGILSAIICTPNMHHVHHHYRQPYSDMNYGNIFSFWDRLFQTYVEVDNDKLVYGLDTHMSPSEVNNIPSILRLPFTKHRAHIPYQEKEIL